MAWIKKILVLLRVLGLVTWRDIRSFGSIAGQNFFFFVLFVTYQQAESAEFLFLLLALIMLFPLSADAMDKIPFERRICWPVSKMEWSVVRAGSFALNPIAWLTLVLLLRTGWRIGVLAATAGAVLQTFSLLVKRVFRTSPMFWLHWIPALPGVSGKVTCLQWREMLQTLDPYVALALMACTELYKTSRPIDPAATRIISLLITLAMSTQAQVLFAVDGPGAERYRQLPLSGWRILLAKDLAFLSVLALLVLPLDFTSGFISGVAVLTIGHRRSVLQTKPQVRWRFTSGALLPDGLIQIITLFAVGLEIKTVEWPLGCLCITAWLGSLLFYGWQWDRRADFRIHVRTIKIV